MSKRTIEFSVEFALTNAETKQTKLLGIFFGYFMLGLKKSVREVLEDYNANFDEKASQPWANKTRILMEENIKTLKLIFLFTKKPGVNRESLYNKFKHRNDLQKKWFYGQRSMLLGLVSAALQAKRIYNELLPHIKELRD